MDITYKKVGDYYYPELELQKKYKDFRLDKYGRLRLNYLKENKHIQYEIMKCEDTLIDHLTKNTKTNTVYVDKNGKEAVLSYKKVKMINKLSLVDIELKTGRNHQIRVQFSSRNTPLWGDQRYNKNAKVGQQIALFSYYLSFIHPTTKEIMEFSLDIPNREPFNLYK